MLCKWCKNSKQKGRDGVYCLLYGIMVHATHMGCKYFKEKDEGNATDPGDRNGVDVPAAEERR